MMRRRLIVWCAIGLATPLVSWPAALIAAEALSRAGNVPAQDVGPVHLNVDGENVAGELAPFLSTYNLFRDPRRQIPNDGVIPYDLNTPHFADYATLHRFVWMPEGRSCQYGPDGKIAFPVGSAIIITIGYAFDLRDPEQGEQLVETRLLMRKSTGWVGAQYAWNDNMTEAQLVLAGEHVDVSWIDSDGEAREHNYHLPNRNQCLQCHEIDDQLMPLGPVQARTLNKRYRYEHGEQNQLEYWSQIGYLSGLPDEPSQIPRVPAWNNPKTGDLSSRARAYLDMNCSSCHRPGGIAFTSGLDLRYEQDEPVRFGIFKAPVAAGRSAGNARFVIKPGEPEQSILILRLRSTDPGIRMPIVGRGLMHEEGVALIHAWISELTYPELAARQSALDQQMEARRAKLPSSPLASQP